MNDLSTHGPTALILHLGELLTAQGVDFETDSSGTKIALVGDASVGQCTGIISAESVETEESMNLLQVAYALPFETISEGRWSALYELLALLTPHLIIGVLELDHEVSELRWRAHQLLSTSPPWNDTRLMALPLEGIDTIERLFETISKVVDKGDDPCVAVAEMLLDGNGENSKEGIYEGEILRLLKTARRRIVTTDVVAIDRVSGLLLRLTQ